MSLMRSDGWAVPNVANLLGVGSSLWNLLPVLPGLGVAIYVTGINAAKQFFIGGAVAVVVVGVYVVTPGVSERQDLSFRRATIAERYFRPAGRMEQFPENPGAGLSLRSMQWTVADTRGYAPDDFPYLAAQPLMPGPTATNNNVVLRQKQQNLKEAEDMLVSGEQRFPFARCEFSTNLAVIYFTTNRKDQALAKLESVQSLVKPNSSPVCLQSPFLLGSLYREFGRETEATASFQRFLVYSTSSTDPDILNFRKQAGGK
jgi:hypothetical protein